MEDNAAPSPVQSPTSKVESPRSTVPRPPSIRPLPAELVRRIAAGEIIERPASVVKELIENCLDAGARRVGVELEAGGIRLIRVADDGAGIPEDELELAVTRHATSKLSDLEDLARIGSLGFRGEALASVAAVSDLAIVSRPPNQAGAGHVVVRDGAVVDRGRRAHALGTTVTVRHLFRHLPGRLKFLKSDRSEAGAVQAVLTRYALAFPEVRFSLAVDGKTVLATEGRGGLVETTARLLQVPAADLIELSFGEPGDGLTVSAVLGLPGATRPNRSGILLSINRRPVENPTLRFAFEEAYQGYLPTGRHPIGILHLAVPAHDLDVNVHPTKAEVRLAAERATGSAIHRAVRAALGREAPIPEWGQADPAGAELSGPDGAPSAASPAPDDPAAPDPANTRPPAFDAPELPALAAGGSLPPLRVLGQAGSTYVTAEGPDGLYLIDQHAAHERITYERLRAQFAARTVERQGMLAPELVELDLDLVALLAEEQARLDAIGFSVEPFGEAQALVRAVPGLLAGRDPATGLREILRLAHSRLDALAWVDRALTTVACHGSIRAGQTLSPDEMRTLVRQLEETPNARTCPHGRPTIVHLSATQLERQFGRR